MCLYKLHILSLAPIFVLAFLPTEIVRNINLFWLWWNIQNLGHPSTFWKKNYVEVAKVRRVEGGGDCKFCVCQDSQVYTPPPPPLHIPPESILGWLNWHEPPAASSSTRLLQTPASSGPAASSVISAGSLGLRSEIELMWVLVSNNTSNIQH